MPRGIDSLLILVFLSNTSSFRLGVDSRHVRTSENGDGNSGRTVGESEEFSLVGRENVTHRRDNEETPGLSGINDNFINRTRMIDALDNETRIRDATVAIAKSQRLPRAKSETAYRDYTEENQDTAAQTDEEGSIPEGGAHESNGPSEPEDSNEPAETGTDEVEENEVNEIDEDDEKDTDKIDETDSNGGKEEEEEEEVDGENENEESEGTDGEVDEKDVDGEGGEVDETDEDGEGGEVDETDKNGEGGEVDEKDKDGEDGDVGDEDYETDGNYEYPDGSTIDPGQLLEWGMGLTMEDVWNFITGVQNIIWSTGDYILSLVLGNLKRELRRTGMHDKFKAKLEQLAASPDLDRPKAMEALVNEIRREFGGSYEKQIVVFLKALHDGFES